MREYSKRKNETGSGSYDLLKIQVIIIFSVGRVHGLLSYPINIVSFLLETEVMTILGYDHYSGTICHSCMKFCQFETPTQHPI